MLVKLKHLRHMYTQYVMIAVVKNRFFSNSLQICTAMYFNYTRLVFVPT